MGTNGNESEWEKVARFSPFQWCLMGLLQEKIGIQWGYVPAFHQQIGNNMGIWETYIKYIWEIIDLKRSDCSIPKTEIQKRGGNTVNHGFWGDPIFITSRDKG